jgi:hypothetical protein
MIIGKTIILLVYLIVVIIHKVNIVFVEENAVHWHVL